jgi:transcription termination factor NusA
MPAATRTISPDELRARFRAAQRMPQLLEIREQVRLAMRQASDEMDAGEGGDGMAELQGLFAQLKSLLDVIDEKITRQATIDDLERRASGTPLRDGTDRDFQRQCCEFSLFRAVAHAIGLSGVDARREIEVQQELVRRSPGHARSGNLVIPIEALSVQVRHLSGQQRARIETRDVIGTTTPAGGPGGSLIGTYTDPNQYIDVLRPAMVVRQAGARVITDLRENLRLPRMTRSGQPGWFAENTPIPTTDETFDDVVMTPHHDGAIVEVTRNALQQANPEIEAIVREESVENVEEALLSLEGMDTDIASKLAANGVVTRDALADLATDELTEITGIANERAVDLIMKARAHWFEAPQHG